MRKQPMDAQDKDEELGAHFVTRADLRSQDEALTILHDAFPGERIVAEEQETSDTIPPNCTVLDPLDGTANFFNRGDNFGVTICTLRGGVPALSVTYFPVRDLLISAVAHHGCYMDGHGFGRRITTIPWHGHVDKTHIATDVGSWAMRKGTFDEVLRPLCERFNIISSMSAIEGARQVLFGEVGAYYNLGVAKVWDAAGMALAINEAGGVAVAPDGGPICFDRKQCNWIVAGNQQLADMVLVHSRKWYRTHRSCCLGE